MKAIYVKDKSGAWLVKGSLDGVLYDGNGRAFAFRKKDADLLCECFGCTQHTIESLSAKNDKLLQALNEIESGNLFVGDAQNRKDIVTEYARAAIAKNGVQ